MQSFLKWLSIILTLKICILFFFFIHYNKKVGDYKDYRGNLVPKVCFNQEECIEVELAESPEERELGLMFRKDLAEDKGMLFIFPEETIHSFWMRNTYIPLDIIWINAKKEIIHTVSATPCEEEICEIYKPEKESLWGLEIASGGVERLGLKIGDTVIFKNL